VSEIIPGREPWSFEGDDVGVLLLHGLHGCPAPLRPLGEYLRDEGFAGEVPLLPGHGTRWQDLNRVTRHDWAREVVTAFERLRARTGQQVAVGFSFGGALALRLAETRGEDLAGLVLVNPWVRHRHALIPALPTLKWILPSVPGAFNDCAKPGQDELPYDRVPLKGLAQALALHRVVRRDLDRVTLPTLVFTSRQDHTIDNDNSRQVLDGIASTDKEQVWLERSYHVAPLDHDADLLFEQTAKFVRRVTGA
jgi:carboxylesterase